MKKIYMIMAGLSLMFCSCSKMDEQSASSNLMKFDAEYPGVTRASDAGFEKDDRIGIYVTQYNGEKPAVLELAGNYANNVRTTFDGLTWKSEFPIYWADTKFDVYAYYPYEKLESVDNHVFSVSLDQNAPGTAEKLGGYEASDFLWTKVTGTAKVDKIPLLFQHKMSKFVIQLKKGPDYQGALPDDIQVRVHNTVTDATVDIATGTVTKNNRVQTKSILTKKISADRYEAVVVPQRIVNKVPLVEILTKGVSYLVESRFIFKEGVQHTFTITLNGNPEQIKIEIGGELEGGWQ